MSLGCREAGAHKSRILSAIDLRPVTVPFAASGLGCVFNFKQAASMGLHQRGERQAGTGWVWV